jgi:protein-S-isoprenylcysteine O-methyltransferase Ste14
MTMHRQRSKGVVPQHRAGRVVVVGSLLAALHSLAAALPVKAAVQRLVGPRRFAGLYRLGYNLQAFALLGWATWWFLRQPDRELYRLRGLWAWLARAAQLVAGLLIMDTTRRGYGLGRFLGLVQLGAMLRGEQVPATPAAQGPALEPSGELAQAGLFSRSRHPANLLLPLIFWTFPRMTMNRVALAGTLSLYALLGSLHEDRRLRAAYGAAFERYAQKVPFFLPKVRENLTAQQVSSAM